MEKTWLICILVFLFTITTMIDAGNFHEYQNDYYNSYFKKRDISEIPQLGDANPLVNLAAFKARGDFFFQDIVEAQDYKKTVFKVVLEQPRILLADPVSVNAMFDPSKVYKVPEAGVFDFNPISTRGYVSSMFVDGLDHIAKKKRQYYLLKNRTSKIGLYDIYKIMGQELKRQPKIKLPTTPVDITGSIDQTTINTFTRFLLGKALDNVALFDEWFGVSMVFKKALDPNFGSKEEAQKKIVNQMFEFIRSTPVMKGQRKLKNYETLEKEALWFVMWLSAAGVRKANLRLVESFHSLSATDKHMIRSEVGVFFLELYRSKNKKATFNKLFHQLNIIDSFALEVIRLQSPVTSVHGRARKDFVVNSLNGQYQIKKDDYLQAFVHGAMRNPIRLKKTSDDIDLKRKKITIQRNIFAFGGPYLQKTELTNHKCIGQQHAIDMMKMMLLNLLQCRMDIESVGAEKILANNLVC